MSFKRVELFSPNEEDLKSTKLSLKKLSGDVFFSDITKSYLVRYEKGMLQKGCTYATIGIKIRGLRAMFNYAIDITKIISSELYPFGKGMYRIPINKSHVETLDKMRLNQFLFRTRFNAA